jgi:Asp-tRNA(Asn)/Glu-tRNA(Gln) amidotransferase A subunit family amidase
LSKAGPGGLNLLTALEAAERLEKGAITSVGLVEDCLARIAARDHEVRSWVYVDPESALRQARARDNEPRRSALHGIPVGIKDIFDTYDMPTSYFAAQNFRILITGASAVVVSHQTETLPRWQDTTRRISGGL